MKKLSNLPKTWLIDIDGVIFEHNKYLKNNVGKERLLPGVKKFFDNIPKDDKIILLSARSKKWKEYTIKQLRINKVRYDTIIFDLPAGERILINDIKPSGLKTAIAINIKRNKGLVHI